MNTQTKDIYKIYQLMEFFVVKHSYSNIMIKGLASKNEVWLANKNNPSFNIIRISVSTLDDTFTDQKRIDEYLRIISMAIGQKAKFLDLHVLYEEAGTNEIYDTVCLNTDFSSGLEIDSIYPGIKYVVHDVDNPESEIANRIDSVNSAMKLQSKQKRQIRKMKLNLSSTLVIIALCVLNFLTTLYLSSKSDSITASIVMGADYKFFTLGLGQYWRMFTYAFSHNGLLHLLMNMYSLYIIGTYVENKYGTIKYTILVILGIIGSSLVYGVLSAGQNTVCIGMSGAIYALFTIYVIEAISMGALNNSRFVILILINLGLNFMSGVAWQAHLGGALIGLLFYYLYKDIKIDVKIVVLTVVMISALFFKYVSIKKIEPLYLGTDKAVIELYNDIGFSKYANKLDQKIYNYYINIK